MTLEDDIRTLSAVPVFDQLEVEAIRLIAFSGMARSLKEGDVLFRTGDASEGGYLVLSGEISIEREGSPTKHIVRKGALIGEVALVTETESIATATATEPTQVMFVSRTLFRRVLGEFPISAARLRTHMSERLAKTSQELRRYSRDALSD